MTTKSETVAMQPRAKESQPVEVEKAKNTFSHGASRRNSPY